MRLHNSQHTKNIELCTLNGPVFWYVNYTSAKLLFKNALAEKWNRGGKRDRRALKQHRERAAFEGHSSTATGINRPDLQSRLSLQLAVWPGKGPSRLCAFSLKHKMIQNKGVELDDLGSLSHLKVYSWPPAWGWGRRGEGKPEIGGLQRSWRASPSSLRPALHPALALNLRPLLSFPHPGSSRMQRRVWGWGPARVRRRPRQEPHLQILPHFLLKIIVFEKEGIWENEHRVKVNSPSREVAKITLPSLRLITIL